MLLYYNLVEYAAIIHNSWVANVISIAFFRAAIFQHENGICFWRPRASSVIGKIDHVALYLKKIKMFCLIKIGF